MPPVDLASLKELVATPPGKKPTSPENRTPDKDFVAAYVACRQAFDPLFEPRKGNAAAFRRAEAELAARSVPRNRWPEYARWVFETFARIKSGPAVAPIHLLHSAWFLDSFTAEAPKRVLRFASVRTLLDGYGYKGMISAAVEVALAVRAGAPPPAFGPTTQAAGRWLAERLGDVDTVEVNE